MRKKRTSPATASRRRGFTVTELVVAATLLITGLSVAASLTVRCGRLRQDARHYRLAIDELSNQMEYLLALDENGRAAALAKLAPSPQLHQALPRPVLTAESFADADGRRLVLHLDWDRWGPGQPVTLVGWIDPAPPATNPATAEEPRP